MEKNKIEHIITNKLTGTASEEESQILNEWLAGSEENKKEFDAYESLWEKSKELVLSDEIDVEAALKTTKNRIDFRTKKTWLVFTRQAAAVIILAVSLSITFNYVINNKKSHLAEQNIFREINAAHGTRSKLELADGTTVWLNSGSSLRFPISFNNQDERRVELHGEGFFDVTKHATKPFIVETRDINVKVYGTAFDVFAYDEDNSMTVALVEGKVGLEKNVSGEEKELMTLAPNEVVEYNRAEKKLFHSTNQDMTKYLAWRNGQLVFDNDHIDEVANRLAKWYNVEIVVDEGILKDFRFTATFTNESLDQALALLSLSSPMKFKIEPAKRLSDNSYSKRKVILTTK